MKSYLKSIDVADIYVKPDRQRQEFNEAAGKKLAESIQKEGLINPITVELDEFGSYALIAGERRLRAVRSLDWQHVHCTVYEHITDEERFGIELKENLERADLTWQEKAKALATYASFQQTTKNAPIVEIAKEAKVAQETVTQAKILAEHLHDPEVAGAKDVKDAMKIITRKAEAKHRSELAKTFDLKRTPHSLHQGNAHEYLAGYQAHTFNGIISDPPWGVDADAFGSQAGTAHNYKDSWKVAREHYVSLAEHGHRICMPSAFAYVFLDIRRFEEVELIFSLAGWKVWPRPIVWDKLGSGMLPEPDFGPRYTSEYILYCRKGDLKVIKRGAPDVVSVPVVTDLKHGAQKPAGLYIELLSRVCRPGDKILDPYAGSGVVFKAANKLNLIAHGVELEESNFNLALTTMNEVGEDNAATEIVL